MNRWLASGLASLIGLCGSFAAVSASREPSDFRQGDELGSIDFERYCDEIHGPGAVAVPDSPRGSSWGCAARNNGIFDTPDVDYDRACALQYGSPSFARSSDPTVPDAWNCYFGTND